MDLVFEIKGSRFVDLKENGDNIKKKVGLHKTNVFTSNYSL
jgi:hypothetical protein